MTTVLSKPSCVQCNATYRALDSAGIEYEVKDITQDEEAYALAKGLGFLAAPVVIPSVGEPWSGFKPDKIKELAAIVA